MLFKIVVVLVAVIAVVHGQCSPPTGSDGTSDGSFRYSWQNLSNGYVQFNVTIVTPANTWGAIGFSLDRLMPNTDVVIAGDDGNNSFVEDRWNPDRNGPTYDPEQNIIDTSVMRTGDTLYFSFTRPIVSPDNMDIDLDQCVYVLWGLGGSVGNFTSPASGLGGHSSRGVILRRKLCIGPSILQPTAEEIVSSGTVDCTVACEPYFRNAATGFTIGLRRVTTYSSFVVSFSVNTAEDTWAAVGFNFNGLMPNSDVVVGGFNANNDSFVEDRWNGANRMGLLQDTTQDTTEACAARIDETLIVTFVKPIGSSSTPQDINLNMDNPTFRMIWAFGGTVDSFTNPGTLGGHNFNSRGAVVPSITAIEVTPSTSIPTPTVTPIVTPTIETTNIMQTSDGLYRFHWLIINDLISFVISVTTPANTWAAIGFSDDKMMPMSDVIIGGNSNAGQSFVEDRWITDGRAPANVVIDTTQDITATSALRVNDLLTITFTRPLNTNDTNMDVSLENRCVWVLWAYGGIVGDFTVTPVTGLTSHSARGVFPNQLCSGNAITSPTPTSSPSTPSITLNYNSTTLKLTCTANFSNGYQWTDLSTGNVVSNDSIFYTTIGSNKRDYQCTAYNELASKTAVIKGCNPTICAAKDLYLMCQAYIGWSLPLPPQCFQYH